MQADKACAHAFSQDCIRFRFHAHHQARYVGEKNDGDVELIAQLDKVPLLARGLHIHDATVGRVVTDHTYYLAVHARERSNHSFAKTGLDFKHRIFIDDQRDQLAHVIGLACRTRDDAGECIFAAIHRVAHIDYRRQLPHILRHVTQKTFDLREAVGFALRRVIDGACGIRGNLGAAEFFLGDFISEGALHHRRPRREYLALPTHHH